MMNGIYQVPKLSTYSSDPMRVLTVYITANLLLSSKIPVTMKSINHLILTPFLLFVLLAAGCAEDTDVVESGTYEGTIDEVVPEETEIYVETTDDQRLELYFTEQTQLVQQGETVSFDSLQTGQKVRVTVERVGQRLDPVMVEILE